LQVFVQRLGWRMNHEPNIYGTDGDASKGAAVYTPLALALYDLAVLRISNSFVWECDSHVLLDFYNQHISDKHLDIGVGTGYFLDKCRFPSTAPTIALFDLNPHSLARSAKRLRRYNPSCYLGNALQRIDISMSGFDSISLNYLLHCLPGNLASKSIVFEHVKPLLRDGGVIFGSTILGEGVRHNPLAKKLMKIYNAKGIFSNLSDRRSDLESGLKAHFDEHTIHIAGCVALFSARRRMARTVTGDCRAVSAETPLKDRKGLGESRHL
jgi:SAM-dependent methyltransferase